MDSSSNLYKSLKVSMSLYLIAFNIFLISGSTFKELLSCNKSLAFALPNAILPDNLSKSYTS